MVRARWLGRRLVGSSALAADGLERAGVGAELPCGLLGQLGRVDARRRGAPHGAEAGVRGRRREAVGRGPAGAGLGEAEVVRGREVELGVRRGRRPAEGPVERRAAQRRARGRRGSRRRGLVVISQAAGLGAVGGTLGLLVAAQAELVRPVERHVGGCWEDARSNELKREGRSRAGCLETAGA